jgi:DNA repair protein RadA/Sms
LTKSVTVYTCNSCYAIHPTWAGKCSKCGEWNSLSETDKADVKFMTPTSAGQMKKPISISQFKEVKDKHIQTLIPEFDRLLGKGFVKGSVNLLGGEPGIGKSTLSLQIAKSFAMQGYKVLYVSGEESANQLYGRAKRLDAIYDSLYLLTETNLLTILHSLKNLAPDILIMDSIQVVFHPSIQGVAGSVNQVRYCASELTTYLKDKNCIGVLIGHVTKEGYLAGPKVLEHMVDVIMYFEGDKDQKYRILRSFKNRYHSTQDIGFFEMTQTGLKDVPNPSSVFVDMNLGDNSGSAIAVICDGARPILLEVQALVVDTGYGMAKRTFLGVDPLRANLMVATLEKQLRLRLANKDIILNIIGGMKVKEPALDLAMIAAILSSYYEKPIPPKTVCFGEVGLTGEVRQVSNTLERIKEASKFEFSSVFLPEKRDIREEINGQLSLNYVKNISDFNQFFVD